MNRSEAAERADTFIPHRFSEHTVDLGEVQMNYVVEGDESAPALLLIPSQTESWWGYEEAVELLSKTYRTYAVDLRGQGRSTWTPGRYTLDNFGNDLVRFIDLVIGRPTIVAGNSSGGLIAAWLGAYAKPGQIRAAMLEDPPLFASEATPPYGPGMRQTLGPLFQAWAKWLGDQWVIGDWDGLLRALPHELPAPLQPAIGFMHGDGTTEGPSPMPLQRFREYDPEWARAWATDVANAGVDHREMLTCVSVPVLLTHHFHMVDPATGHLIGAMTDLQARQAREHLESTGHPIEFVSLDAPHTMHDPEAPRYVDLLTDWIQRLPGA